MSAWIERRGSPGRFRYVDEQGRPVRAPRVLERIERLRVPPAWRDVHVAASARAAVQAWGYDARGRKQYRYHDAATERGALRKYYRVRQMGRDLPAIRRAVDRDFRRRGFDRARVCAAAVRLLGDAFFRIGSERYAEENRTFGLTTLRKAHVAIEGDTIRFSYVGKGGIRQRQVVVDRRLARFVGQLLELPGGRLFRYEDEAGRLRDLTAAEVNEYLRALAPKGYTAKDFRTWGGTLRLATVLHDLGPSSSDGEARRTVALAIRLVAADLGNTPTVCRQSYVHPIVVARYLDEGETIEPSVRGRRGAVGEYQPAERALLRFLDRHFPERRRRWREHRDAALAGASSADSRSRSA